MLMHNIHTCVLSQLVADTLMYLLLRKRETEVFARGKTTVHLAREADQLGWEYRRVFAVTDVRKI